jgi:acyl-coenzyme A synthetase/AMP-(fatty) acid ligase
MIALVAALRRRLRALRSNAKSNGWKSTIVTSSDVATTFYTTGTTGLPKPELRQLGDVGGDAAGFAAGQELRRIAALNWLVCG